MPHCAKQLANDQLPAGWERLHTSAFSRVAQHREQRLFFKLYLPRSPLASIHGALRGTRALRGVRANAALSYAGFRAPNTILHGKLDSGREYVFTEQAPGESVYAWLSRATVAGDNCRRLRHDLLSTLGLTLGRLHANGFLHRQLSSHNLLAHHTHGRFDITVLNNEHLIRRQHPSGKAVLLDLIQLTVSAPDALSAIERARFFSSWRRQMRHLSAVEARVLAREVNSRSMANRKTF